MRMSLYRLLVYTQYIHHPNLTSVSTMIYLFGLGSILRKTIQVQSVNCLDLLASNGCGRTWISLFHNLVLNTAICCNVFTLLCQCWRWYNTVAPAIRHDAPPEMMALLTSRLDTARSGERENDSTPQPSRHDDVTTRNVDAFIFASVCLMAFWRCLWWCRCILCMTFP